MLGYSEASTIYFSLANHTGFARIKACFSELKQSELSFNQYASLIESGHFNGLPNFKYLNFAQKLSISHKQCHSAEHQTYNAFQRKIRKLTKNSAFETFKNYLPSTDEIQKANPFSLFCGTSFIISSSLGIILMCLPNLFKFHNTDLLFMIFWLVFSIVSIFTSSYLIQSRYLAKPNDLQIFIAQQALKEVLHGNNN